MKLVNKADINRVILYFFYDPDGVVDEYVTVMLDELKLNSTEIVIICNGKLNSDGREKLERYTKTLVVRENTGYDIYVYREFFNVYDPEKLKTVDEFIFVNSTIMGPIYPFKDMFEDMNKKDIDFWGITKHHRCDGVSYPENKYNYIPEHIQSYFIAVRKKMLNSYEFKKYWFDLGDIKYYNDSVGKHEVIFTKVFEEKGYKSDSYIDTEYLKEFNLNPSIYGSTYITKDKKCPIFKRRLFFNDYRYYINESMGENTKKTYDYIKENNLYDMSLFWDNMLRSYNIYNLVHNLNLRYILDENTSKTDFNLDVKEYAIIFNMYYIPLFEYYFDKLKNINSMEDIIIFTDSVDKKNIIMNSDFFKENIESIRVYICDKKNIKIFMNHIGYFFNNYKYLCFLNDSIVTESEFTSKSVVYSSIYKNIDSLIPSKNYINNVINIFKNDNSLGILIPQASNHERFYNNLSLSSYNKYYKYMKVLLEKLGYRQDNLNDKIPLIAPIDGCFWCKSDSLADLFSYNWNDIEVSDKIHEDNILLEFGCLNRIICYVGQKKNFYTSYLYNMKIASLEINNMEYMLTTINSTISNKIHINSFVSVIEQLKMTVVDKKNNNSGGLANYFRKVLSKIFGYNSKIYIWIKNKYKRLTHKK